MADRFHRAARDGIVDLLKEANRKDCNPRDDDGMTPTLWAAFEGKIDALRLIVGRGGDPEKYDHYGNTALHFAAARGHMNCVTFLISYGVNIYAKDIDNHTAKDLAAMNDKQDILRYLDEQAAKQQKDDPKKVKSQMEKATKEAEKLIKEFAQVQEKARKLAEKEKKRLEKERERMERSGHSDRSASSAILDPEPTTIIPRPSLGGFRRDSRLIYEQKTKFSDLVNPKEEKDKIKLPVSAVYKKVQRRKAASTQPPSSVSRNTIVPFNNNNGSTPKGNEESDFKIGAVEDGKRSVRSISGLRRDSEIMYVPKYDDSNGKRTALDGVFPNTKNNGRSMSLSVGLGSSKTPDSGFGDDESIPAFQPRGSIFERPGFGGLAFRNSISALAERTSVMNLQNQEVKTSSPRNSDADGAKQMNYHQRVHKGWEADELDSDEASEDEEDDKTPMYFFLAAVGLEEFIEPFVKEKFDLDSLMLVSDADLVAMNIPRGYRLKLLRAIADRKAALEEAGELEDSHL